MTRAGRLLVVVALVVAATGGLARPAAAADPRLRLLTQPAWASIGGTTALLLDIPAAQMPADTDVTLRLRVYDALESLDDVSTTATGADLSGRLATRRLELAELVRDVNGAINIPLGIGNSSTTPTLPISDPGVYPLEVALETGDDTLTAFVTWIVAVDPADVGTTVPLRVAWLWSVSSPPVRGVDEVANPAVVPDFAPGGRLDGISSLIATGGAMPMTLQVGPETLEAWSVLAQADPRLAPGLERITAAAARTTTELLVAPYVGIDLTSLEATGLGNELPDQLVLGSDTLERLTGARPDPRTVFVDPADPTVLARLRGLLVDRVVVRDSQLTEAAPLTPVETPTGTGSIRALATTSIVARMLEGSDPPALRAQRALAALSLLALEDPEAARGIVIAPVTDPAPDVELYSALIGAMRSHPLFTPTTVGDVFANVNGDATRDLAPHQPEPHPLSSVEYLTAKLALGSLTATLLPDTPVLAQGGRALVLALSTEQPADAARQQLGVISAAREQLSAGVGTTDKRITLTSRRADVPLTFRNDTGAPIKVRVHLDSTKLLFPDGGDVEVELPPGNSTQRFAVEARTSGTFTMTVKLTTPDGRLTIGPPAKVTVRSAVFSGVGAAITAGALLFLALWWGNHFRRTRRARAAAAPA